MKNNLREEKRREENNREGNPCEDNFAILMESVIGPHGSVSVYGICQICAGHSLALALYNTQIEKLR